MDRIYGFPDSAKNFHLFEDDEGIKAHKEYKAAKQGDAKAAVTLVWDLASEYLHKLTGEFHEDVVYVSPFAREAGGDNAIPPMLVTACVILMGGYGEDDIVQVERVYHTGADPMERMSLRPSFEGAVIKGQSYVLVDDVTNMGGTLAELANYIILNGGEVAGSVVLCNAGRCKEFVPEKRVVKLLGERFGDEVKNIFGIRKEALTANEANYLIGFRSPDEIRNRLAKAKKETVKRLRSKGIQR